MSDSHSSSSLKVAAAFVPVAAACVYFAVVANPWIALLPLALSIAAAVAVTPRNSTVEVVSVAGADPELSGKVDAINRSQAVSLSSLWMASSRMPMTTSSTRWAIGWKRSRVSITGCLSIRSTRRAAITATSGRR